jgi:hypothetical protein
MSFIVPSLPRPRRVDADDHPDPFVRMRPVMSKIKCNNSPFNRTFPAGHSKWTGR